MGYNFKSSLHFYFWSCLPGLNDTWLIIEHVIFIHSFTIDEWEENRKLRGQERKRQKYAFMVDPAEKTWAGSDGKFYANLLVFNFYVFLHSFIFIHVPFTLAEMNYCCNCIRIKASLSQNTCLMSNEDRSQFNNWYKICFS